MKYALINNQRQEAKPGLSAKCPGCEAPMVAKCGEVKIWHWSHLGKLKCDLQWENETEWHRNWKGLFPEHWQEVFHQDEKGNKHIADVKTDQGWVLEFQHSSLKPEERRSRNNFYPKLAWVVDGTRRKKDQKQFMDTLRKGRKVVPNMNVFYISPDENTLLTEWADSNAPVFIDFGPGPSLWWFLPKSPNGKREFVGAYSRVEFVNIHLGGPTQAQDFEAFLKDFNGLVAKYYSRLRGR
jgi:competence protein CoiA